MVVHMIVNGGGHHSRQIVKVMNSEGRVVYVKPNYPMVKGSDTSAAESGSEAEDTIQPTPTGVKGCARLCSTPVHEEARSLVPTSSLTSEFDNCIPMVDKIVDSGFKKETHPEKFHVSKGLRLYLLSSLQHEEATQDFSFQTSFKDDFRPPSPMPPSFTDSQILAFVRKKLCELEEKVSVLEEKPSSMPCEKEELLSAAACRVDALEAELISTKKVSSDPCNGRQAW